jgi:hypothetical protein
MRVLVVGFAQSIHVARWLSNLDGTGWDVHFVPVAFNHGPPDSIGQDFAGLTVWDLGDALRSVPGRDILVRRVSRMRHWLTARRTNPAETLAAIIREVRPDVLHSMEFQHCGYLADRAMRLLAPGERPPWLVSNYGSDISLFGRLPEHQPRIRSMLAMADVMHCECARDVELGRAFGFRGQEAPLISMGGGWDLDALQVHRMPGPASTRRTIALKGYEHFAGRAGVAVEALRRCGRRLAGYRLELYAAFDSVLDQAQTLAEDTGLDISVSRYNLPYEEVLAMHGRARCSIGLSLSDGTSVAFLEAMAMGAFPVQSWTNCGNEWIEDGVSGLLVPPEDPDPVAAAILRAVTDDALVDRAAILNEATIRERLEWRMVQRQIEDLYRDVAALRR